MKNWTRLEISESSHLVTWAMWMRRVVSSTPHADRPAEKSLLQPLGLIKPHFS